MISPSVRATHKIVTTGIGGRSQLTCRIAIELSDCYWAMLLLSSERCVDRNLKPFFPSICVVNIKEPEKNSEAECMPTDTSI